MAEHEDFDVKTQHGRLEFTSKHFVAEFALALANQSDYNHEHNQLNKSKKNFESILNKY